MFLTKHNYCDYSILIAIELVKEDYRSQSKTSVVSWAHKDSINLLKVKEVETFTWEKLDYVDKVKAAFKL